MLRNIKRFEVRILRSLHKEKSPPIKASRLSGYLVTALPWERLGETGKQRLKMRWL
jgi:hypothetical protein